MTALTPMDHNDGLPGLDPGFAGQQPGAYAATLTRQQKAAIVLHVALAQGVAPSVASFPEEQQAELARLMATMGIVDKPTLNAVVEEFIAALDAVGLTFPSGLDGALKLLDGTISPVTAARIRKASGVKLTTDPWETIQGIDADRLLPILEEESVEIAAVLLSKVKVSSAAELLGQLPGPRARQIAYAVSLTGQIAPDVVEKIGRALAERLDAQPARAFDDGPVERVGAILNFSPAATRDEVLTGLDEEDAVFANEVRKAIFTFANIPTRIDPRDIPKITRDVDPAVLITALAAATGNLAKTAEFILGAMSKRMADQMREEIEALGTVKDRDGEAAMSAVVATIRELEAAGELLLLADEE